MIEDTSQAVCDEAKATLDRIRGPLRARVVEIIGEAGYQRFFKGSQARIRALESKSLVHLPLTTDSSGWTRKCSVNTRDSKRTFIWTLVTQFVIFVVDD